MDPQFPYLDPAYVAGSQSSTTAPMTASQLAPAYAATGPLLQNDTGLYAYQDDPTFAQQQFYGQVVPEMPEDAGSSQMPFRPDEGHPPIPHHDEVKKVSDVMKDRRREKNRASQAAFRERRKIVIEGLKEKLRELQGACDNLQEENTELRDQQDELRVQIEQLTEENRRLRTSMGSSPSSESGFWQPGPEVGRESLPAPLEPPLDGRKRR